MNTINFREVYKSEDLVIFHDANNEILKNVWLDKDISTEMLKSEMHKWMEEFKKYKPSFMLTDNTVGLILGLDIQKWIADFLFPTITDISAKKWAIIVGDEIFSAVSTEQMTDEKSGESDDYKEEFFENDETAAIKWLLK